MSGFTGCAANTLPKSGAVLREVYRNCLALRFRVGATRMRAQGSCAQKQANGSCCTDSERVLFGMGPSRWLAYGSSVEAEDKVETLLPAVLGKFLGRLGGAQTGPNGPNGEGPGSVFLWRCSSKCPDATSFKRRMACACTWPLRRVDKCPVDGFLFGLAAARMRQSNLTLADRRDICHGCREHLRVVCGVPPRIYFI